MNFQNLSGQISKKVIDLISQTEQQLLRLLMHTAPERLAGDDLLASFGF
jgi:chemotaxis protein CheZ